MEFYTVFNYLETGIEKNVLEHNKSNKLFKNNVSFNDFFPKDHSPNNYLCLFELKSVSKLSDFFNKIETMPENSIMLFKQYCTGDIFKQDFNELIKFLIDQKDFNYTTIYTGLYYLNELKNGKYNGPLKTFFKDINLVSYFEKNICSEKNFFVKEDCIVCIEKLWNSNVLTINQKNKIFPYLLENSSAIHLIESFLLKTKYLENILFQVKENRHELLNSSLNDEYSSDEESLDEDIIDSKNDLGDLISFGISYIMLNKNASDIIGKYIFPFLRKIFELLENTNNRKQISKQSYPEFWDSSYWNFIPTFSVLEETLIQYFENDIWNLVLRSVEDLSIYPLLLEKFENNIDLENESNNFFKTNLNIDFFYLTSYKGKSEKIYQLIEKKIDILKKDKNHNYFIKENINWFALSQNMDAINILVKNLDYVDWQNIDCKVARFLLRNHREKSSNSKEFYLFDFAKYKMDMEFHNDWDKDKTHYSFEDYLKEKECEEKKRGKPTLKTNLPTRPFLLELISKKKET